MKKLIGREPEQAVLAEALASDEAELVAITGRRRVGKTFLVRSVFNGKIALEFTGVQYAPRNEQIASFHFLLQQYAGVHKELKLPKTWLEAFHQLILVLEARKNAHEKLILFFDELPWLATKKSGFLRAFGFFWNNWASKNNVLAIICGSSASWIIEKVVKDKGGLHNRITKRLNLQPFNLSETEDFFYSNGIKLNRYHTAMIYMIMGGIPHYLKEVKAGKSAIQNIEDICFSNTGLLADEFANLYPALFEHSDSHIAIVKALGTKWKGLTRAELVKATKLPDGGGFTKILGELSYSGFISEYLPFGKTKKDILYRLTDEYSLFYITFLEKRKRNVQDAWQALSQTPMFSSWSGYAFESLCLKHVNSIKEALKIGGIYTETSSFIFHGSDELPGAQIDLLIDRKDQAINLCEIKFHANPFVITKQYADNLRSKIVIFKTVTKTKKQVFLTMITSYGLMDNAHSRDVVDISLTMDVL